MNGTSHSDEIGLAWADPSVSARHLACGKPLAPEQVLAIAFAESLAEKERLRRERQQLEGRLKGNARNDEMNDIKIARQQEALRIYGETGEIRLDLVPECEPAIRAELAKDRRASTKSAQHEVDALCEKAKEDGWELAYKKNDGKRILVTFAKPLKSIAPELKPLRRFQVQQRIRRAVDQLKTPGLPRPIIARRALEIFMLNLRPSQVALLPAQPGGP